MPGQYFDTDKICHTVDGASINRVQSNLIEHGYAVVSEDEIEGLSGIRKHMMSYFVDDVLKQPDNDTPPDRKRARDVIAYEWHDDGFNSVKLTESPTITLRRPNGDRDEYSRVVLLQHAYGFRFAVTVLSLVPPCWRHRSGTLGINLLRTFTDVVTRPHQERSGQFIGIWVIDKHGDGAETYLYDLFTPGRLVFQQKLTAGELIIFNDELFLHGATALEPVNDFAQRDVIVFVIHFPGLY